MASDRSGMPHPPSHPTLGGKLTDLQRQVSLAGARTPDDYMTAISDAVHRSDDFLDLFSGTVWGRIVWDKNVGRPTSPRMAAAFLLVHKFREIRGEVDPSGTAQETGGWLDAPTPQLWDGPHDEDHYRVSFMLQGVHPWTNVIGLDLNPQVAWEPSTPAWLGQRSRYLAYPQSLTQTAGAFWPARDGLTDLDDFEVLWWTSVRVQR